MEFEFSYLTFYLYYFLVPKTWFLLQRWAKLIFLGSALPSSNNSKINCIIFVTTFIFSCCPVMFLRIPHLSWQEGGGIFTLVIIFSILNISFLASHSSISIILVNKSINRNSDLWDFCGFLPHTPIKEKKKKKTQWFFQKYMGTWNAIIELGLQYQTILSRRLAICYLPSDN